jgi:hypothetical protein
MAKACSDFVLVTNKVSRLGREWGTARSVALARALVLREELNKAYPDFEVEAWVQQMCPGEDGWSAEICIEIRF